MQSQAAGMGTPAALGDAAPPVAVLWTSDWLAGRQEQLVLCLFLAVALPGCCQTGCCRASCHCAHGHLTAAPAAGAPLRCCQAPAQAQNWATLPLATQALTPGLCRVGRGLAWHMQQCTASALRLYAWGAHHAVLPSHSECLRDLAGRCARSRRLPGSCISSRVRLLGLHASPCSIWDLCTTNGAQGGAAATTVAARCATNA